MSIYKNYFTNIELNYAYNFDELVEFYKMYKDLMEFWSHYFSKDIVTIKYEDLIKNPKKEIPKLIDNCGLNWEINCLKFYNNKRVIKTASDTQVRNKIYKSSINTWKNYQKYLTKGFKKLSPN
jgi:LPS sulfotransferase NodH